MDISIVTGTYNRFTHLKRMIDSVRHSIGTGLVYEIVVVDGGSTDETQKWCEEQKDIKFIQQGELLGAIKAFNEGCYAAAGDYVIIANDDIEFIEFSILNAYAYMQDNPGCGVGCFKQDRGGKQMHVAVMPALMQKGQILEQISVYYGQVCIVPKWLGDKVGWWGDTGARTYGGDNELSCNVYEMGYKCLPLPCACIHDFEVEDTLRSHNNKENPEIVYSKGGTHPDTEIWLNKWRKNEGVGPIISEGNFTNKSPLIRNLRIHYSPIFEPAHSAFQRTTKVTLRKELQKLGKVYECDYMTDGMDELLDSAWTFEPDIFVMQVHSSDHVDIRTMLALKNNHPDAKFFNWNGDYHPSVLMHPEYIEILKLFNIAGFVTTEFDSWYEEKGVKTAFIQAGYEEWHDDSYVPQEMVDFIFLGNGYSKTRLDLAEAIMSVQGVKTKLIGSWPREYNAKSTLYDYVENYRLYKSSRFIISDQQWPHATGYVSDRLMHAMRSGQCVLQQGFAGMEELMGLKHGENLLVWNSLDELKHLMKSCMSLSEEDRVRIGLNGQRHIMENYSYRKFVDRMMASLKL